MTEDSKKQEEIIDESNWVHLELIHNTEDDEFFEFPVIQIDKGVIELADDLLDRLDEYGEEQGIIDDRTSEKLLVFITASFAWIEEVSATIITNGIVDEKYSSEHEIRRFFQERMTQQRREELLYKAGIIDAGIKGELVKSRRIRNEMVHNSTARHVMESPYDVADRIKTIRRAVSHLQECQEQLNSEE